MKLVMDEKLKHRLVGVSVILSLGVIFLPAMLKKSNQGLENNLTVKVQLPPKPTEPKVAVINEKQMFKTVKIAKPNLHTVLQEKPISAQIKEKLIASAALDEDVVAAAYQEEPVSKSMLDENSVAKIELKKETKAPALKKARSVQVPQKAAKIKAASVKVAKLKVLPKPNVNKIAGVKKDIYAVQLASFSELRYAQALVNKLHSKGYKANYIRVAGQKGVFYKVFAGHSPQRDDVVKLKLQFASTLQLNGFIVNTGVS